MCQAVGLHRKGRTIRGRREKRGKLFKLVPLFIEQFILQDRELCHFL